MQTLKPNKNGTKKIKIGNFEIWFNENIIPSLLIFNKNLGNMQTRIIPTTRVRANTVIFGKDISKDSTSEMLIDSNTVTVWDYPQTEEGKPIDS